MEWVRSEVERVRHEVRSVREGGEPVGEPEHGRGGAPAERYDLLIVGSGSAAFAAAIRARELGASVALCESGAIGGTCVNVGCVPSKAMLAAAEWYHRAGERRFPGVGTARGPLDLEALVRAKDELVDRLREEKYEDLADGYGLAILRGPGRFTGPASFECDGRAVAAARYLVATGVSPSVPPIPGLEEAGYLTSTTALELRELPRSLVVIGANAIGLEMGQLFLYLGTEVTWLEALPRIAPFEEPEISGALTEVLLDAGAEVHTGVRITRVEREGGDRVVVFDGSDGVEGRVRAQRVLVATGRRPNTSGLGLELAGVELTERGAVKVDAYLRTTNPRIWAAGDVTGSPQFVYLAAAQGSLAADDAIGGVGRELDLRALPRVTFTSPQIASVGMTEAQAVDEGLVVESRTLELGAVPRAIVNRDTRGLVKLVAERGTGRVLGVHVLAEGAGEVILAGVYAIAGGMTVTRIAETWAPYLTMAEGLKLAAQSFTRDVSKLSCCAA